MASDCFLEQETEGRRNPLFCNGLEWLAVVDAITLTWRHYLEDRPFQLLSDHAALERKLHKSAHDPPVSSRQARWIERLLPFAFRFQHIPGDQNPVADALSRFPCAQAASVTLLTPAHLGLLHRARIAAEEDESYREEMRKSKDDAAISGLLLLHPLQTPEYMPLIAA